MQLAFIYCLQQTNDLGWLAMAGNSRIIGTCILTVTYMYV